MFNNHGSNNQGESPNSVQFHDIHPLSPPRQARRREPAEEISMALSRESNSMVGMESMVQNDGSEGDRIEDQQLEQMTALAIVPENNTVSPVASPRHDSAVEQVSLHRVKKEEVESKISAWEAAKIAKINNWFKREDVITNGWEDKQVEKASCCLKKVERKLDEQRARAVEKMQNDVAKARRKAEEKRASAQAKRGTKVVRVMELAKLMRAIGRAPSRRSFF